MKKRYIFALAAIMTLTACGDAVSNEETTALTDGTTTESVNIDPGVDELPDDLDFGGETVTFLYREEVADEFCSDEANGDPVNDALYDTHRSVEERLGVKIEVIKQRGQVGADRNTYMNLIRQSVMSNDDVYDWVDLMIGNAPIMMSEGIFRDLAKVDYIDPTKAYYMKGLADLCTIDGKLYFVSGDASLGYLQDSFCVFFNKALAEDYKLGDLYDLVDSGEWTLDKLTELTQAVSKDLDGDGAFNDNDQLGFRIYDQNHLSGFIASTGLDMCEKDSDGKWVFDMSSERNASIVEKLHRLIYETDGGFMKHESNCQKFANNEVLFITAQFDDAATQLRDMKSEYGDPDMAGAVLEAIASGNSRTASPAYFEIAMKTKFSSDEDTARMYDIIHSGMKLDFGYIFSNIMEGPVTSIFINSVKEGGVYASKLASNSQKVVQALDAYIGTICELKD